MKIAAIIENEITVGGGFSQALSALIQMRQLVAEKHDLTVYTPHRENLHVLTQLGFEAHLYRLTLRDRMIAVTSTLWLGLKALNQIGYVPPLESILIRRGVDLIYFVTPTFWCMSFQRLNYIMTVWDGCHRDAPEFPEVREHANLLLREQMLNASLAAALLTLADSEGLAEQLAWRYGLDRNRILAMPFAPSPFLADGRSLTVQQVLDKYELQPGYYFYPAQFWAHKNHFRILQAAAEMVAGGLDPEIVFAGGDQGNLEYVQKMAAKLGVDKKTRFLGFVPGEDLRGLYEGSSAVVMPTYFGPTNIPPLEAWACGIPLIYSRNFQGQVGDAALLIDPDDSSSLADAMVKVRDEDVAQRLVREGRDRLELINNQKKQAEQSLLRHLEQFCRRRETWQ